MNSVILLVGLTRPAGVGLDAIHVQDRSFIAWSTYTMCVLVAFGISLLMDRLSADRVARICIGVLGCIGLLPPIASASAILNLEAAVAIGFVLLATIAGEVAYRLTARRGCTVSEERR